jgi:sugar lactone lactonase YvrE
MRRYKILAGIVVAGLLNVGCTPPDNAADKKTVAEAPKTQVKAAELRLLASGASISGANGIHFGPDGMLYVASVFGSELVVLDPKDGRVVKRWNDASGITGPDDVAFNAAGDFYWTSILTGEVAGFTAAGERRVAANLGPGVNPLTFSDDGRLFVAQCYFGTGLYEVDPLGVTEPRMIRDDLGPGCGLNGMDWGPDGRLYGPRVFVGTVVSIDVDTGEMREEATGFKMPAAVKFDSNGQLHVLDTGTGEVLRMTADGPVSIAKLPSDLDNFAFDADDTLFVSSHTDGFVARIDADGPTMIAPGGMAHAGGVALQTTNADVARVMVADFNSLRSYDPQSGEEKFTQGNAPGVSEIDNILSIAADGDNVILTSWTDNSVRIWHPDTEVMVSQFDELAAPIHAVRFAGSIAVTLHGSGSVALIDQEGNVQSLADGFVAPTGLAVHGAELLMTDRQAGTLYAIKENGDKRVLVTGLDAPEGVAVSGSRVFVMEGESGAIKEIVGSTATTIAQLPGGGMPPASASYPPSMIFNGLAADANALYATDERTRALYRIDL